MALRLADVYCTNTLIMVTRLPMVGTCLEWVETIQVLQTINCMACAARCAGADVWRRFGPSHNPFLCVYSFFLCVWVCIYSRPLVTKLAQVAEVVAHPSYVYVLHGVSLNELIGQWHGILSNLHSTTSRQAYASLFNGLPKPSTSLEGFFHFRSPGALPKTQELP